MNPYYSDDLVTLYHGDCREVTEWLAADVLVTDPPYGMNLLRGRGRKRNKSGSLCAFGVLSVSGDETTQARDDALTLWGSRPALVFGRWSVPRPPATRALLTWEKGEHVGMGDLRIPWKPNTEEIYVLGHGFQGRRTTSVLRHHAIAGTVGQRGKGTRHHPTEKPISLLAELIGKCPEGVIADPFAGSGPTLLAARNLGRRAIGIEMDERYCEIVATRLSAPATEPLFEVAL